jgi:hypothetical protein
VLTITNGRSNYSLGVALVRPAILKLQQPPVYNKPSFCPKNPPSPISSFHELDDKEWSTNHGLHAQEP